MFTSLRFMPALKQLSPIPCAVTVGYAVLAAVVASVPLSKRMESERIVLLSKKESQDKFLDYVRIYITFCFFLI